MVVFHEGRNFFMLDMETFAGNLRDIRRDEFSPWTGSYLNSSGTRTQCKTHTEFRNVQPNGDNFEFSEEGFYSLNVYTNIHPIAPQVKREIAYILDENSNLSSNIWICYMAQAEVACSTLINPLKRKRRSNFEYEVIKNALKNRTTAEAKKFLAAQNIFVTSAELASLSRSVASHVKSRKGRKPATDATALLDRFASNLNKGEILKPLIVEKLDDKVVITQLVGYKTAIAHYVKSLPFHDELMEHRENVCQLERLPVSEAELEFGKYLNSTNLSGSLPLFGSSIFIDTTFSLVSGENVTLAIGLNDQFRTSSGKNASFLLAVMIHTKKNLEAHERFSSFLNECMANENPQKRVPSIITDGENSFRVYQNGLMLKDCVPLRCDVHRSENMKLLFRNDRGLFESFKESVFGSKIRTEQGIVLRGGLLGVLSRREFERKLDNLLYITNVPDAKNWLINNADSLYQTNSLIKKLEGGWPGQQFLTTNIIEGRNAYLKDLIQSPVGACFALDEFLNLHEEEMRDRKHAVIMERSPLVTDFVYPRYHQLLREEKASIMAGFGFEDFSSKKFEDYPDWVSSGDGKIHRDLFLNLLDKVVVSGSSSNENTFFVENLSYITKVEIEKNKIICYHPSCMKSRNYTYIMCIHMLSVFDKLPDEKKLSVIELMERHRNSRTVAQVRFRSQSVIDGTKYNVRKGKQLSKHNGTRAYHALTRLSLGSSESEFEKDNQSHALIDSEDDY